MLCRDPISTNYECYKKLRLVAAVMAVVVVAMAAALAATIGSSSGYNVGGYTMVVYSALHKQLCWEFGVSHNCICIISEGPLMYVVQLAWKLFVVI